MSAVTFVRPPRSAYPVLQIFLVALRLPWDSPSPARKPGVTSFINDAISFEFPQLVQHFFTTDIKSRSQFYRCGFSHRFQCVKTVSINFLPVKLLLNSDKTSRFPAFIFLFQQLNWRWSRGRLGAASCRRTGGTLRPLLTCFAHFVSCRSASRFNSPSVIWRSIPFERISRHM